MFNCYLNTTDSNSFFPFVQLLDEMSDLPYAVEAQVSLSEPELQVRQMPMN